MKMMQRFLNKPIGGILIDPIPDRSRSSGRDLAGNKPMKKAKIMIMWFWHSICMSTNSQNFVDWRAI
jgi:hypothetical protein